MKPYIVEKVPSQAFNLDTMIPFVLNPGGKISTSTIILYGTFTVTGATAGNIGADVIAEGLPAGFIKNLVLRGDAAAGSRYPSGEIVNLSARGALRLAMIHTKKLVLEQSGSVCGNGANGTYSIYLAIPVYFASPKSKQLLTALNTDPFAYNSLTWEVYTGDLTTGMLGNNGVISASSLRLRIINTRHNTPGDSFVRFIEDHQTLIPATQTDFVDQAMPKNGSFLRWLLLTETTAFSTLTDGILNRVQISGKGVHYEAEAADVRDKLVRDGFVDASATQTGMYLFDLCNSNIQQAVPAASIRAKIDLNMLSANPFVDSLHFVTERLFAPYNADFSLMPEYAGQ